KLQIIELWGWLVSGSNLIKTLSYLLVMFFFLLVGGWLFRAGLWLFYHPVVSTPRKDKAWPFVSVIMPAYNEEKYIGRAISSVLSSDYPEEALELICVNDGSKDKTGLIMNKMKNVYKDRLKIIEVKRNQGKKKRWLWGLRRPEVKLSLRRMRTVRCIARQLKI
ncbi:MAG: glycosyltransferase, partial [Candidatus Aminicenantes bacterium]|nr:glycosyltransferase [Candidatus Aminicenantes bacterium]